MRKIYIYILLSLFITELPAQDKDSLIVGYNISPPFTIKEDGSLMGLSLWLWEQIAEENKIPYKTKEMPLDSLLLALSSGEIDISASPLTITSERFDSIGFTVPFYIAYSSLLIPKISAFQKAIGFIRSFISLNFFRAMGALAFVILIFGLLEWYFERKYNKEEFGGGLKGLWNGFWWSAVTMTTVGYGDKSPRTVGGRIVALIWMFTAVIIISGFTASIASSLTVNQMHASAGNLIDFKEKRLGTIQESGTEKWLQDNFYSGKISFRNMEELIKALKNDDIDAIAYDRPHLQSIIENDTLSNYHLLDIKYNPQYYAFGLNRNLPEELKKNISLSILRNTESMDWKVLLAEYNLE